jgi:hypothetical protein
MSRTQEEILGRFRDVAAGDMFGFRREVLCDAMDAPTFRIAVGPESTIPDDWEPLAGAELENTARGYLTFAIGKILDHRGISAERSVAKLAEYAWLMGRDDVVAAMRTVAYPQYGAPKVLAFAAGMGWEWPHDDVALERMAAGEPCSDDCDAGCGA